MIIGNIDENGYLIASLEEIAGAADTEIESVRKALDVVQSLDPPGIGARDLAECLLLQLAVLNLKGTIIEEIILHNIEDLEKRRHSAIAQQYSLPLKDIMDAVKIIEGLEPRPGSKYSEFNTHYITPDVYLMRNEEGYQIILNDEGLPRLRVSSFYKKLLQKRNTFKKEDKQFLIEKMRSAIGLLKSLDQRDRTIYRVTETLLHLQYEFFDKGAEYLKPLTLKDVASVLDLHESTVSRVTSNKILSCEHGIFSFRFLFSSALNSGMGSVSSTSVKNIIKKILTEENSRKPFSDQHITEILKKDGISIARRTVAKYREDIGIPSQSHRKKLTNLKEDL
jgi:RNA polymerase sigma-54 factor